MKRIVLFLGLLVVSGCGNRTSIADQCTSYGWQPGTPGHANCQMRTRIANDNLQQQQGDALLDGFGTAQGLGGFSIEFRTQCRFAN